MGQSEPERTLYLAVPEDIFASFAERCDESSRQEARVIFKENIQEPYSYFCHVGLNCFAFPVVVEGKSLAVFLSGKRWDPGYSGSPEKRIEIMESKINELKDKNLDEKLNSVPNIDPIGREKLQADLEQLVGRITKLAKDRVQSDKGLRQRLFLYELKQRFDLTNPSNIDNLKEILRVVMQRVITFCDLEFALLFANLSVDRRSDEEEVIQLPLTASAGVSDRFPDNLQLNIANLKNIFEKESQPCIVPQLKDEQENKRQKIEEILLNNLAPSRLPIPHELQSEDLVCIFFTFAKRVAEQFHRKAAERGIEIIIHPDVFRLPRVELDWDRMSGAFANLIDNAVKYSHANKTVDIHGNLDGDYVKVTVGDYGLGIPEKDYERIFEPYYTSPVRDEIRSIDGMGIGLAVVKEVVEQHEGNVWVECSEPVKEPDDYQGRLVIFTVRLPLKQSGG